MFGRTTNPRARELGALPLFAGCTGSQLEAIARLTDEVERPAGWVMTVEGDVGHECFVIVSGQAAVLIDGDEIARLGPGDVVGEMALLERDRRVATVIASTPLRAVVMTLQEFDQITDRFPSVTMAVMQMLSQRLRDVQAA